jgi:hypothetical protein
MDFNIGRFYRNGSKPPNASKKRGEHAGLPRFINLEASHGGFQERLHMPPSPIAGGDIEHS